MTFQEQIQEQPTFLRPAGVDFGTAVRKVKGVPVSISLIGILLIKLPCSADTVLDVESVQKLVESDGRHSVILGKQRNRYGGGILEDGVVIGNLRLGFFEGFFQKF